jgi:hypothetical protein
VAWRPTEGLRPWWRVRRYPSRSLSLVERGSQDGRGGLSSYCPGPGRLSQERVTVIAWAHGLATHYCHHPPWATQLPFSSPNGPGPRQSPVQDASFAAWLASPSGYRRRALTRPAVLQGGRRAINHEKTHKQTVEMETDCVLSLEVVGRQWSS